jgi:tetratricopeptide (TPR) repeat protein
MTCPERDLAVLVPFGEGPDEAHLAVCGDCAREAELSRAAWDLGVPDETVPAALLSATREAIQRASRPSRRSFEGLLRPGAAAAAALLLFAVLAVRPAPPPPEEVPQLYAADEASGEAGFGELEAEEGPLGLRSHAVSVTISDWVIRTEVEEVFFNASDRRLEGTFVFPLPADASLSRFAMEVNGTLVEGELVERGRAREVYEGIVRRMQDPALLEWMPGNVFKARVFPIEPRSEKRVILAYTQAPRMWQGAVSYVYPLVSEKTKACPPDRVSVRADVRLSRPIASVESSTHRVDVERRDARSARAELELRGARPAEDFRLRVGLEPAELELAACRPEGEDGFFGLAFAPQVEEADAPPGTYVFVVDRSARMSESELSISRRVVDLMIGRLGVFDRAGIVAHHVEAEVRNPEGVLPERRGPWRDFLSTLRGEGASDVLGAIRAASALAGEGGTVVYVGKGVATWGETENGKLAASAVEALRGRGFRAVLVGRGANEEALSRIAALRDGAAHAVRPGGDTAAEIAAAARTISLRPVQGLSVSVEGATDVVPSALPAVFPGERIHVFGRYATPGRAAVLVRGFVGGRRFERRIEAELSAGPTEHSSLQRLWAQRALSERTADCQRRGEPADLRSAIVAMSRRYQVMTPYTSFLVLESEEAYKQYQIDRAKRLDDQAKAPPADERTRLAERFFQAGDVDRARAEAGEAVKLDPKHAAANALLREADVARGAPAAGEHRRYISEALVRHSQTTIEIDACFERGLKLRSQGDREAADREFRKILEYAKWMPAGVELDTRVKQVRALMGADPGSASSDFRVRIEQAQIEITKHVRDGERFLAARMPGEALRELEAAEEKIVRIPYEVKAMNDLLPLVREAIVRSKNARAVEDPRVEEEKRRGAEAEARLLDWRERRLSDRRDDLLRAIDAEREKELLFGQAQLCFEREGYVQSAEALEKLLRIDPASAPAREMLDQARRLNHMKTGPGFDPKAVAAEYSRRFAERPRPGEPETWRELISKRTPKGIAELPEDVVPEDREIRDKLRSIRVTADLADAPLTAVVDHLREITGLNLHLSGVPDGRATFRVADARLDDALRSVLAPRDLAHVVRDGGVLIVPAAELRRGVRLELYDVQDLTYGMQDFPGVDISLARDDVGPRVEGRLEEDPDLLAIGRKLRTMKIDLAFENTELADILAFIRDFSGLNLVVDVGVDTGGRLTFRSKGRVLGEVLRELIEPRGLHLRVTEEKVVLITSKPVRFTGEDLAGEIRSKVRPGEWSEADGRSVQFQNGLLIVRGTGEQHREVGRFLAGLRGRPRGEAGSTLEGIRHKMRLR